MFFTLDPSIFYVMCITMNPKLPLWTAGLNSSLHVLTNCHLLLIIDPRSSSHSYYFNFNSISHFYASNARLAYPFILLNFFMHLMSYKIKYIKKEHKTRFYMVRQSVSTSTTMFLFLFTIFEKVTITIIIVTYRKKNPTKICYTSGRKYSFKWFGF